MPTVSKADAIAAAKTNLAQVLQAELEPNIGERSIKQLKQLVEMLQQTTTLT